MDTLNEKLKSLSFTPIACDSLKYVKEESEFSQKNTVLVEKSIHPEFTLLYDRKNIPINCHIVIRSPFKGNITIFSDNSFLYIGKNVSCNARISIGNGLLYIGDKTRNTGNIIFNVRNNGFVYIEEDCLMAPNVIFMTDDMHSILDINTMKRINTFGGKITIKKHVWIGYEAMILGDTVISNNSIVGARALCKGEYPCNAILTGSPAKVSRTGVTWDQKDINCFDLS